jgi:hypothetical protein
MKRNLIIIILSNSISLILIILFLITAIAGTSKRNKIINSIYFIDAGKYYSNQMKTKEKEIEETPKYIIAARINKNIEYEAKNITTSKNYNEILNEFLDEIKINNSKNIFRPINNYEYITDYRIVNNNLALILTDKSIYIKNGEKWEYVSLKGINKTLYFQTGEIFFYNNEPYIIVGTSYSGVFYKKISDKLLKELNTGVQSQFATDSKLNFFETISKIYADEKNIFLGYKFSKGIDIMSIEDLVKNKNPSFVKTKVTLSHDVSENIESFYKNDNNLFADTNYAVYKYDPTNSSWNIINKKKSTVIIKKTNIIGIYLNPYSISSTKKIDNYIAMSNALGINAFVIDFKDDWGNITYSSDIEFAKTIGSVKKIIDIDYLIKRCRENKIKIIARVVSFKDGFAYDYNNNEYALWDYKNDKAWLGPKDDKWIDPYNEDYRKYLIEVGKELEGKGVDEIQYDYVRFPSDGEIGNIQYRYRKDGYSKNFILYKFFSEAKHELSIPLSADFYGYNCWYSICANVGQDISLISKSIDIVYPMYYPSHFVDGFYEKDLKQYERNYYLYYHGILRAYDNSKYKIEVRPWIQIFNIKVDIPLKDYITSQIEGLKKADINSYIFWSASSNYKILYDVITKK